MNAADVRNLNAEELTAGRFPVNPRADFRLHMTPEVHRGIQEHAKADVSIEICGVLVGQWERDENGPFTRVTDYIRCDNASSKFAEVTFTHESWAQINSEMDSRFADARIIGWYHSHPDFGIFLSERDRFIQEHFFSGAGQIAYVVDPVRDLEGVFEWRGGKPEPMSHYWIGDEVRTVEASRRNPTAEVSQAESAVAAAVDGPASRQSPPLSTAALMLGGLSLLLLGYLYGGWRSRWEQKKIVEGAVAHYGVHKLMKLGMEENLTDVLRHLRAIRQEFAKLPESTEGLTNEQHQAAAKQRKKLADNLLLSQRIIENIQRFYGLSEVERNALARLITRKQQELIVPPPKQHPTKPAQKTAKQSKAESAPAEGNQAKNREPDAKMVVPSNGESEPAPTKQEDSTS